MVQYFSTCNLAVRFLTGGTSSMTSYSWTVAAYSCRRMNVAFQCAVSIVAV